MVEHRLLVVEDDPELRTLLVRGLGEEGFDVTTVGDGATALTSMDATVNAVVMDISLPDADGRDVCLALRARGWEAPVLFLTARDAVTDRLSGFGAGGDDYLVKPFSFDELVARLRALLRRSGPGSALPVGGLRLDPLTHAVVAGGSAVSLTPTEFRVLATLAGRPGTIVRRRDLVRAAWPQGAIVHENTLDQYIARLRRKLGGLSDAPVILTTHGVGYRLG